MDRDAVAFIRQMALKLGHFEFEIAAIHARGKNGDNSILVEKGLKMQNSQQIQL